MNRFSALSTLLIFAWTDSVSAQAPPAETTPYLQLWAAPEGGYGPGLTDHASQIVRLKVDDYYTSPPEAPDPEACAREAAFRVYAQTWGSSPTTDPGKVALLLQNLAVWSWAAGNEPSPRMVSLLDPDDGVNPDWTNPLQPPIEWQKWRCYQPWMTNGRERVKMWFDAFIEEYERVRGIWLTGGPPNIPPHEHPLPIPHRLTLDSEVYLSSCCSVEFTRILEAVAAISQTSDRRWYELELPGNGNKTMDELYQEATDPSGLWRFPDEPIITVARRGLAPSHDFNRRYFLWYYELLQREVDYALWYSCYNTVRNTPGWAACKISNYEHCIMDGKVDTTFGWQSGRHPGTSGLAPFIDSRTFARGFPDFYQTGAQDLWRDFVYDQGGPNERPSSWLTHPSTTSADFSAPVLYQYSDWHKTLRNSSGQEVPRKLYYRRDPSTGTWPDVTHSDVMLANGRRVIEAILNTPGGHNHEEVTPWMGVPGTNVPWTTYPCLQNPPVCAVNQTQQSIDDCRRLLQMLRAKGVLEILLWWNDQGGQYAYWDDLKRLMQYVFTASMEAYEPLMGTCTNCPPVPEPQRLRYTLRDPVDPLNEVIELRSYAIDETQFHEVALKLVFGNLDESATWSVFKLTLECVINSFDGGGVGDVRGLIYVLDPGHPQGPWVQQTNGTIDDFGGSDFGFGFFAPYYEEAGPTRWYETRREFEELHPKVIDGEWTVKIVLRRPRTSTSSDFKARFDLAQLYGYPIVESEAVGGIGQGADFNHSQSVTFHDLAEFMADFAAGRPSADFNQDGVINLGDLAGYQAAFASGPP